MFPGSTLSDHCLRYENIPQIKLIVVLGELGGQDEYSLVCSVPTSEVPLSYEATLHPPVFTPSGSLTHLVSCRAQLNALPSILSYQQIQLGNLKRKGRQCSLSSLEDY